MIKYILTAALAYLLGNLQFAVLISRLKYKDDIRNHGSGNAGSTNMLRVYGAKPGLITFVGDFLKGALAVLLGRWIAGEMGGYIAAVCVVLGHCFPVFLGFKGGKGVASGFAIIWMLNPLYGAIVTVFSALLLFATHIIAAVSLGGATLLLAMVIVFNRDNTPYLITVCLLWALIMLRHWENIQRLLKGEENKVLQKKKRDLK